MKIQDLKLQDIPYYAIAGLMLLLSMLIYTTRQPDFASYILPTYLTEALLFFVLGFAFWKSFKKNGFTVFIMALMWLFNQMLWWGGASSTSLTVGLWLLLLVQAVLAGLFFTDHPIKYLDFASDAWPYASGFVLLLFSVAKMYLNISLNAPIMFFLWGLAIGLISFGYIIRPKAKEYSAAIQVLGLLFAVVSAFAIGGSGLTVAPFF